MEKFYTFLVNNCFVHESKKYLTKSLENAIKFKTIEEAQDNAIELQHLIGNDYAIQGYKLIEVK
ncbi:hypothetical protein [Robertmurraya siralis]|uniref:hypothetical protein n=1 Tax=Robertmurraya siralis TaxID=77777 RepID=UPI0010F82022|nr:hypothetical protein [Robertmurraya siralis]